MKQKRLKIVLASGSIVTVVGLSLAVSFAHPGIREMSRQVGGPVYQQRMQRVLRLSDEGHTALYHGDYALAEKKLRQSLALDTTGGDAGIWRDLGRALEAQGRSLEAHTAYREAFDNPTRRGSSSFPDDIGALTHYSIMCEDSGQHEAAVRAYNKAVEELSPRQTSVELTVPADARETPTPHLRALLDVLRGLTIGEEKNVAGGQDRSGEALEAFREAAQQQPNDARVQYYLGYGSQKVGQFTAARAAYGRAARLDTAGVVKAAAAEGVRAAQARRR
jgi:Flp pilus assembly protein TadD